MAPEPPKVVHLDELPAIAGPGSLTWRPVRLTLELTPEAAAWARDDEDFEGLDDDPGFRALTTDRASR